MPAFSDKPYTYALQPDGTFSIGNYSRSPAFSSFLPGIADAWGIPLWVFYCNRGQGIACFGSDSKDQPVLEFQSATRAYQLTPAMGFRTFLKLDGARFAEPFARPSAGRETTIRQRMDITSHGLGLCEENDETGIRTEVSYFTVPNEAIGALGRKVTLTNTGSQTRAVELLDGLPFIANAGLDNQMMKHMPYLAEAWSDVEGVETRAPLFKIRIATDDTPEVRFVRSGNIFVSKAFGVSGLAPVIVDPRLVFGEDEAFLSPERFQAAAGAFSVPQTQCARKGAPCAFALHAATLAPGASFTFVSYAGRVNRRAQLDAFLERISDAAAFTSAKEAENRAVIRRIQDDVLTVSADKRFDFYTRQNYLDNVLRGGIPCQVGPKGREALLYLYARKHGDMERDYNWFRTAPTRFSQGNGNYRDVNQNRRNDVLIHPYVEDAVIRTFVNLLQLDGNNPLDVQGARFFLADAQAREAFVARVLPQAGQAVRTLLHEGFTPGELLAAVDAELEADPDSAGLQVPAADFIAEAIALSERDESARHGEGYWTDHWTYNTDLVERYLAIFPERAAGLFFDERACTFHDTFCHVTPRSGKHVRTPAGVRQFGAVTEDKARHRMLEARSRHPHAVRTRYGEGDVYRTSLFAKLLVVALNKAASLDPSGVGIEMDSNKPDWYDALNGLPGLFGSSTNETYELVRLLDLLVDALNLPGSPAAVTLPVEAARLLRTLDDAFRDLDGFALWAACGNAKEAYRALTFSGVDGAEELLSMEAFRQLAGRVRQTVERNRHKGMDPASGLPLTYFTHEAATWEETGAYRDGQPLVRVTSFRMHPLPLFLEGVVHAMRCEPDVDKVRAMHRSVLDSPLYDRALGMFKVNAPLEGEAYEIGRCRAFPAGWLENGSVWLHMEYKYLLELARKGLFDEFHEAVRTALVCNLDPHAYGRSILENDSFICSSAFYDESRRGRGYYARLSGSTAEFVHMWLLMVIGDRPFRTGSAVPSGEGCGARAGDEEGGSVGARDGDAAGGWRCDGTGAALLLVFAPAIPGRMFTRAPERAGFLNGEGVETELEVPENAFCFRFLGRIPVVYHNPARCDTWSPGARVALVRILDRAGGCLHETAGAEVAGEWAERIRARDAAIGRIEVSIAPV